MEMDGNGHGCSQHNKDLKEASYTTANNTVKQQQFAERTDGTMHTGNSYITIRNLTVKLLYR